MPEISSPPDKPLSCAALARELRCDTSTVFRHIRLLGIEPALITKGGHRRYSGATVLPSLKTSIRLRS